jgi:hypothetical protein
LDHNLLNLYFKWCATLQFEYFVLLWQTQIYNSCEECKDNVFFQFLHHHETLDIQWFFIFVDEYFSCAFGNYCCLIHCTTWWNINNGLCDFIKCFVIIFLKVPLLHNNIMGVIKQMWPMVNKKMKNMLKQWV